MLKTISAALLAASLLVAPAMAGTVHTSQTPAAKTTTLKSKVLNANAKMGHHPRSSRHVRHHQHRHHHHAHTRTHR
jgi:hypothetical protein